MKQKDLAKEYATARLQGRLSGNEVSFSENKVFTEEDIEQAFNEGLKTLVESISDLAFKPNKKGGLVAENTPFIDSYRLYYKEATDEWSFSCGFDTPEEWFNTKDEAINAANKDYRRQLKETFEQILK